MSGGSRWRARRTDGHAEPELERASSELIGKLDAMTARLRATVDHLVGDDDEDETTDPQRQEEQPPDDELEEPSP